ncbi:MAG: DMT family transporter [Geminicoccaceae bacterium]|nr:DMT family transporter [Geminicoccaceae bacterium]
MRALPAHAAALDPLRARWSALPDNVRGAAWILLSCLFFSSMAAIVKLLGSRLDSLQLSFFRALFGFLSILPFVAWGGLAAVRTTRLGLHVSRGLLGATGMLCGFYAITHLSLAEATAIGFTKPLFMVVLAALILGEVVRARRWTATAIGFIGVLVMARPIGASVEVAALVALIGAFAAATVSLLIKRLSATEGPLTILFYLGLVSSAVTLPLALIVWRQPSVLELALMAVAAAFASLAQVCMIRGFRIGEASALAPFDYARLPLAAGFGFLLFGEVPDLFTFAGAGLIVASTLYIARREATLGKRERHPRTPLD